MCRYYREMRCHTQAQLVVENFAVPPRYVRGVKYSHEPTLRVEVRFPPQVHVVSLKNMNMNMNVANVHIPLIMINQV